MVATTSARGEMAWQSNISMREMVERRAQPHTQLADQVGVF